MPKITHFFLVLSLIAFSSCGASFGEKYERGNLEVFYTEEMKDFVIPLADYFEANDLIFDHKHSILLTSTPLEDEGGSFILKMVANKDKEIPTAELNKNTKALENALKDEVFMGANFKIEICDENFVALKK